MLACVISRSFTCKSIEEPADGKKRFCPCQHWEIAMRFIVLVVVLLLTETSLSFAQGQMASHKSSKPAAEMRSDFADSNLAMMERFNNACSRTGPDLARVAKKYLPAMACDALSLVHSQNTPPLAEVRRERESFVRTCMKALATRTYEMG